MAAISTLLAVTAVAGTVGSAVVQNKARKEAGKANEMAAGEQRQARSEEVALSAQRAAQERRQQVREERVMRGKLLQASQSSGTVASSGEMGAQANLATQLGANIGFNLGQIQGANAISIFNQNAANFQTQANNAISKGQSQSSIFDLVSSVASTGSTYYKGKGQ